MKTTPLLHRAFPTVAAFSLTALSLVPSARAGDKDIKQVVPTPPADSWEFKLALPSWLAATSGTVGIGDNTTGVYLSAESLIRHLDMIATLSAEARKGRFGIYGDFLYVSASDGVGTNGLVSKVDLRLDQYLADMELF